jgi:hypothetical protein
MNPIKYIKGNKYRAEEIKQVLCELGATNAKILNLDSDYLFYYLENQHVYTININDPLSRFLVESGEEIKLHEEKKLPKTWEEWVEMNSIIKEEYFINTCGKVDSHQDGIRCGLHYNNLSSKEDAESLLALIKLKRLRDCYNDGWLGDFKNGESKFCIEFNSDKIIKSLCINCNTFLSFRTQELRDEFLNNFRDLIEKSKMWL